MIHEARHSYQGWEFARNVGTNNGCAQTPMNDDDPYPGGGQSGDLLAEQVTFSSANQILDSVSGHGDSIFDFNIEGDPLGYDKCEDDARAWEPLVKN